jgi:hypothetical protein
VSNVSALQNQMNALSFIKVSSGHVSEQETQHGKPGERFESSLGSKLLIRYRQRVLNDLLRTKLSCGCMI